MSEPHREQLAVRTNLTAQRKPRSQTRHEAGTRPITKRRLPFYDPELRQLRVGHTLVKRLTRRAQNVEKVLVVFQEEHWRRHIDNPLSGPTHSASREKLRDVVKKLNHNNPFLRFHLDGTGEGVWWEPLT